MRGLPNTSTHDQQRDSSTGHLSKYQTGSAFFLVFFKWRTGVLVSGTSLTNGLIQTDHDTKKVWAEKNEKKSALQFLVH